MSISHMAFMMAMLYEVSQNKKKKTTANVPIGK